MFNHLPFGLEQYIYTRVPDVVLIGGVILAVVLATAFRRYRYHILLVCYLALSFCNTVICRVVHDEMSCQIIPFHKIIPMLNGDKAVWWEVGLNLLMFVPIGILLTMIRGIDRWKEILITATILSGFIEVLQYIFRTGMCETDDVIVNVLGCGIGMAIVLIYSKLKTKQ